MGLCYVRFVFRQICNLPDSFQFACHCSRLQIWVTQEGW